jgi:mRNA interferase HigB
MRVIARNTIEAFWRKHADSEQALRAWFTEASRATWKSTNDIKAAHANASFLEDNRVVFSIKGNTYRVVTHIHYGTATVMIRFIGTHAEYDRIDARTIGKP